MTKPYVHLMTGSSAVQCGAPIRDGQHPDGWHIGCVSVEALDVTCPECYPQTYEAAAALIAQLREQLADAESEAGSWRATCDRLTEALEQAMREGRIIRRRRPPRDQFTRRGGQVEPERRPTVPRNQSQPPPTKKYRSPADRLRLAALGEGTVTVLCSDLRLMFDEVASRSGEQP